MGFRERLGKAAGEILRLPIEAQSFEDYLLFLEQQEAHSVAAVPSFQNLTPQATGEDPRIRITVEYSIQFSSSGSGRQIRYRHACQTFEGPNIRSIWTAGTTGFRDIGEQIYEDARDRTFLTAREMNNQIQKSLGIPTDIKGRDGVFAEDDYAELDRRAKARNLRPW